MDQINTTDQSKSNNQVKHIVVIGGGFAGVNLAERLLRDVRYHITLVDRNNYNFFPPLIYQVATGFLEISSISYPFRKLFKKKNNFTFRMGEVLKVDTATQTLTLSNGELQYDYLVFANGTETNYFGNDHIKANALPIKTLNDALVMRNVLLQRLEQACITKDPKERKRLMTFVVAGGGPTGVEVSGMLAEFGSNNLPKDYPELNGFRGAIYLVNGGPVLLEPMSAEAQKYTYEQLLRLGVKVRLNARVKDFVNNQVVLADGGTIDTATLIWAAGVTANVMPGLPPTVAGPGHRLNVDAFNKLIGLENIYAIGDTCIQTTDPNYPHGHPQLAQVAIQQGKNLAKNFLAQINNKPLKPFSYYDKGTMAIITRNKAVADIPKPKLHVSGFIAFYMWLFIHLTFLITYRNRLATLYNWAIAYLTRDQSLRMIVRPTDVTSKQDDITI